MVVNGCCLVRAPGPWLVLFGMSLTELPNKASKEVASGGWAAAPRSHGGAADQIHKRKLLEALGAHAPCGHRCALHPHSVARMWWPCPPLCLGPLVAPRRLYESCLTFWLGGRRGGDPSKGDAPPLLLVAYLQGSLDGALGSSIKYLGSMAGAAA